ncbi:MAG: SOS response-associated peptidase [Alkalilacustris sp.]
MCGRFTLTHPTEALALLFEAVPANDLPPVPRYNICPTQPVAAVISEAGTRRLAALRWGFVPGWYERPSGGPLLINARAEGIAEKPAFREAARARRCLIPATGFYEWTEEGGARQPWYIHGAAGLPLAMAGIWQVWERGGIRLVTCAVVTCAANATLAPLHHRMPVFIAPEDHALWLGEAGHGAARLMRPAPDALLAVHRVGRAVNSNRAEGAGLIAPV